MWPGGRLQYQRNWVRIIFGIGNFIEQLFTICRKKENKEKEAGKGSHLTKSFKLPEFNYFYELIPFLSHFNRTNTICQT